MKYRFHPHAEIELHKAFDYYEALADEVIILAVMHLHREPGYWRNRPGGIGALGTFFVVALLKALGVEAGVWTQVGLVIVLIVILGWVNVLGVVWGGHVQNVTTWIKAGGVALVAIAPFALQAVNGAAVNPANYRSTLSAAAEVNTPTTWIMQYGAILLAVMWAYNGWSGFTPVSEEIREPQRNIPLALLAGMGIVMVLYVSASVAYHGVL